MEIGFLQGIRAALSTAPVVRAIWRWLMERDMDVTVIPSPDRRFFVQDAGRGVPPTVYVHGLRVRLINHRTDRREHIIGARAELRKRKARFWRQTIGSVPLITRLGDRPIDLVIEPQSGPVELDIKGQGPISEPAPDGSELTLVLEFSGPIRKVERPLTIVRRERTG